MLLLLALACAPQVPPAPPPSSAEGSEVVVSGPLSARVSQAPADLDLFYIGEHMGNLETCGCPHRPRGSVARLQSMLEASVAANPSLPWLLVHGGYFLEDATEFDGSTRLDVPVMNRWMVAALDSLGVGAVNLTYHDLPGYLALENPPPWVVSANLVATNGARAPARSLILDRGDLKIGVTGISDPGMTLALTPDHRFEHGYRPALEELRRLAPQVDVLVLLAYKSPEIAKQLAEAVPQLDVVVDTNMHQGTFAPVRVNETLWVRSHYQTQRVGELRIHLGKEGLVDLVVDRQIDLDPEVPDAASMSGLVQQARDEIEAAQREMFESRAP